MLQLRDLVFSVCGQVDSDGLSTYSSQQQFFRIGLPRWLYRITLGVGVFYVSDSG